MRTNTLEERTARIEGILEQMSRRLDSVEARLSHLDSRLWWMMLTIVGIQVTMWVTIILTIFFRP